MVNVMNLKDISHNKNHFGLHTQHSEKLSSHAAELKRDISMPMFNLETNMSKLKEKLS